MSMYTKPNDRSTDSTDPKTAIEDQQRTGLSKVRQRLFDIYEYVRDDDPELYQEINRWLRASVSLPDGSVGEAVQSCLRELKRGNKMRDHHGVDDPTDAFPDDCEGCEHYGVACPMVKGYRAKKTIKRVLETAESDEAVIKALSDLAIENNCHVVLDELESYQGSHGKFLQKGYELDARATAVLAGTDALEIDHDEMTTEFTESDIPTAEDEARMEATIGGLMTDEEDEDE